MDASTSLQPANFPHLVSPSFEGVRSPPRDWSKVFVSENNSPKAFSFSHFPSEPDVIPFTGENLRQGGEDWKLCLVGYSIGRRPYYEALLGAINKTWSLKGSVKLLSLNDGFFLLRFSCCEDYEMVWSRGVWFLLGKPFVLQKWHPKFTPKKEDFSTVPIWVKIHDLPLACWNSEGISRIASKIGVPLAADSLTEQKTRLTFARVCVLVDKNATYPEEIKVSLDGDVVCLKVQYEWRPYPCEHCKSLMHLSSACPSQPPKETNEQVIGGKNLRGRSNSRKPTNRSFSKSINVNKPQNTSEDLNKVVASMNDAMTNPDTNIVASKVTGHPLVYQPHSPQANKQPALTLPNLAPISDSSLPLDIPNLNSPQEEATSSTNSKLPNSSFSQKSIVSPNKFDALNIDEDTTLQEEELVGPVNVVLSNALEEGGDKLKHMEKSKSQQFSVASKKPAKGKQGKKSQSHSKQ